MIWDHREQSSRSVPFFGTCFITFLEAEKNERCIGKGGLLMVILTYDLALNLLIFVILSNRRRRK